MVKNFSRWPLQLMKFRFRNTQVKTKWKEAPSPVARLPSSSSYQNPTLPLQFKWSYFSREEPPVFVLFSWIKACHTISVAVDFWTWRTPRPEEPPISRSSFPSSKKIKCWSFLGSAELWRDENRFLQKDRILSPSRFLAALLLPPLLWNLRKRSRERIDVGLVTDDEDLWGWKWFDVQEVDLRKKFDEKCTEQELPLSRRGTMVKNK